jgi:uncharacterized protein (DUF1800 family)
MCAHAFSNQIRTQDLADPEARDAYYETEAVIDEYLYNDNTPPFVSKVMIQHFGISNPSPRYIELVATSFKDGQFTWTDGNNSETFGAGEYGDMAATVAAILLDSESTSVSLDADPSQGCWDDEKLGLRED